MGVPRALLAFADVRLPLLADSCSPRAPRESPWWQRAAGAIPDAVLRRIALETLAEERGNLEGAAAFAVFAPWRHARVA